MLPVADSWAGASPSPLRFRFATNSSSSCAARGTDLGREHSAPQAPRPRSAIVAAERSNAAIPNPTPAPVPRLCHCYVAQLRDLGGMPVGIALATWVTHRNQQALPDSAKVILLNHPYGLRIRGAMEGGHRYLTIASRSCCSRRPTSSRRACSAESPPSSAERPGTT